jgi:hypothetical protein
MSGEVGRERQGLQRRPPFENSLAAGISIRRPAAADSSSPFPLCLWRGQGLPPRDDGAGAEGKRIDAQMRARKIGHRRTLAVFHSDLLAGAHKVPAFSLPP